MSAQNSDRTENTRIWRCGAQETRGVSHNLFVRPKRAHHRAYESRHEGQARSEHQDAADAPRQTGMSEFRNFLTRRQQRLILVTSVNHQCVNHRPSTTACRPPLKCQPVDKLTERGSNRTGSTASQSRPLRFSARIGEIARVCGLIWAITQLTHPEAVC